MEYIYFSIPLIIIAIGIYLLLKDRYRIFSIFLIAGGLSIIAYYTLPNPSDDLQRHFEVINSYAGHSIDVIFRSGYSLVYLNNLIMYIIAQTGYPGLYQMIFTLVGYFVLFKFVSDVYDLEKIKASKILVFLIFFFFMISFYKIYILAIRNYFCFILGGYFLFLLRNKKINTIHYILLIFMLALIHPVSLLFMFFLLYFKIKERKIRVMLLCVIVFHSLLLKYVFLPVLPQDNYFHIKLYQYFFEVITAYNFNFMIYYFILAIFASFVLYVTKKFNHNVDDFLMLGVIIGVSSFYQFEFVRRFMYLIVPLLIPSLINIISTEYKLAGMKVKYICYFFMVSLSIAAFFATLANINAYGWYYIF